MKRLALMLAVLFTTGIVYSAPAAAQATRTWVSGVGDDANPCSRTAPCKTFAGAISKTAASGEINCLDPAGFGTVTVVKSITIDCTGTFGSALASSTTGIIVNGSNADVIIRGLSINGAPVTSPGVNGIRVLQASTVLVENVKIFGFGSSTPNGYGILVNPTTGNVQVTVLNSTVSNNLNGGISINPAGAVGVDLVVSHSTFTANGGAAIGLTTAGGGTVLTADVSNTLMNGAHAVNSNGVIAKATAGTATIFIKSSTITNNTGFGVNSNGAGATVRVSGSAITNNGTGVNAPNGGQAISYGNNELAGNTTPGAFTSTVPLN